MWSPHSTCSQQPIRVFYFFVSVPNDCSSLFLVPVFAPHAQFRPPLRTNCRLYISCLRFATPTIMILSPVLCSCRPPEDRLRFQLILIALSPLPPCTVGPRTPRSTFSPPPAFHPTSPPLMLSDLLYIFPL